MTRSLLRVADSISYFLAAVPAWACVFHEFMAHFSLIIVVIFSFSARIVVFFKPIEDSVDNSFAAFKVFY